MAIFSSQSEAKSQFHQFFKLRNLTQFLRALALDRPVFELQKCYLDENWSESNQKLIGVLRPGLACLGSKLR